MSDCKVRYYGGVGTNVPSCETHGDKVMTPTCPTVIDGLRAEVDRLKNVEIDHNILNEEHGKTVDLLQEARAEVEQLRVQLAGCGVAALGYDKPPKECKKGDYGWSTSFGDVKALRAKYEDANLQLADARRTAQHWKGEHLAANEENENLELQIESYRKWLEKIRHHYATTDTLPHDPVLEKLFRESFSHSTKGSCQHDPQSIEGGPTYCRKCGKDTE